MGSMSVTYKTWSPPRSAGCEAGEIQQGELALFAQALLARCFAG